MKSKIIIALLFVLIGIPAAIVGRDSLEPFAKVRDFRRTGDYRMWTFTYRAKDMGRLYSVIGPDTVINGVDGLAIRHQYDISFELLRSDRRDQAEGNLWVDPAGHYLGSALEITVDTSTERLMLARTRDSLSGYFTRGGQEVPTSLALSRRRFAWDANFVDEIELYLALRGIAVGDTIRDSIFVPQLMMSQPLAGTVDSFFYMQLYKGKFDSVFHVHLSEPQTMDLFVNTQGNVMRADFANLGVRAYLDLIKSVVEMPRTTEPVVPGHFHWSRIPQYLAYVLIGLIGIAFYYQRGIRFTHLLTAFGFGFGLFLIAIITQIPVQKHLFAALAVGSAGFFDFIIPGLAGALIQELLKFIGLIGLLVMLRPRGTRMILVGAALGAAFGVTEICYRAGFVALQVFTPELPGFIFSILYHSAAGAVLGLAFTYDDRRRLAVTLAVLILINVIYRVLPAMVEQGRLDLALMNLLLGCVTLVVVAVSLMLVRRRRHGA